MTHALSDTHTLLKPTWFATRQICALAVLSCVMTCRVLAAEPSEEKPAEVAAPTYTVPQSTPIDKVIQTVYANSPLNVSVLRKVLVDANPKVISGNPQQRVKGGTTLNVPEHGQVLKNILSPSVAAVPETPDPGPGARDASARRQWVRFP
jgi:Tfp pilus assembly protein FimV